MDDLRENIDKQLDFNKGKNLFAAHAEESFQFIRDTIDQILNFQGIAEIEERLLVDYATDKVLEEFCRINQYISFDRKDKESLRDIYRILFDEIKSPNTDTDLLAKNHYSRLKLWFESANPSMGEIYKNKGPVIDPVPCSEYSAELQLEVLQVNLRTLTEPVLDIGCGKEARLVRHLRSKGIEAYGFDRLAKNDDYIFQADWFDFDYTRMAWGTVLSNLGFSNHFNHHHLRNDGNFLGYARKYMEILNSLRMNGKFHYAPGLPFIEQYLPGAKFHIFKPPADNKSYTSSVIMKIN